MDDEDIRGLFLLTLYEHRNNSDGWASISEINFSGGSPVTRDQIASAGRYLFESGYINWRPLKGANEGFITGVGQIRAAGIDLIKGTVGQNRNIRIPEKAIMLDVKAKAAADDFVPKPPSSAMPPMGWFTQDNSIDHIIKAGQARSFHSTQQPFASTPLPLREAAQGKVESPSLNPDPRNMFAHIEQPQAIELSMSATRATVPIVPTLYPGDASGTVAVQDHISINVQSTEFQEFSAKMDELISELKKSNMIAGEVRDQLIAELTAGRTLLSAPKPDRKMIDLLLVKPLMYIADKAASAAIGALAALAVGKLLGML